MNTIIFSLLLFATNPNEAFIVNNIDIVEINHLYDENDAHYRLTQIIFYDYDSAENKKRIIDWRLQEIPVKERFKISISKRNEIYTITFSDGEILRKIKTKHLEQTWTQYDPELEDMTNHSGREHRKGLIKKND